ncbi:MAG: sarcosine oxidase subunit gamma [Roseobacter sp.]
MSDAITALNGATFSGIAKIQEVPLQGMITLRGDLTDAKIQKAATSITGGSFPAQGQTTIEGDSGIAWMSPDEALILCAYDQVAQKLAAVHKALGKTHALAVNVSDARASFQVTGTYAADVLAKLCPVDLSAGAFKPGQFRRTRMAQVPAAFWQHAHDGYQVICFRSQAQYVFDLLSVAAQPGSEVFVDGH